MASLRPRGSCPPGRASLAYHKASYWGAFPGSQMCGRSIHQRPMILACIVFWAFLFQAPIICCTPLFFINLCGLSSLCKFKEVVKLGSNIDSLPQQSANTELIAPGLPCYGDKNPTAAPPIFKSFDLSPSDMSRGVSPLLNEHF